MHDALLGQWVDWVVPSGDIPAAVSRVARCSEVDRALAKRSMADSARWASGEARRGPKLALRYIRSPSTLGLVFSMVNGC